MPPSKKARRKMRTDDAEEQRRLHEAAAKCVGTIAGLEPYTSTRVRELVRKRLLEKYGRRDDVRD